MNTQQAVGPGGQDLLNGLDHTITTGAVMSEDIQSDFDKPALSHGLLMAVVTLAVAPLDFLATNVLRRWPLLNLLTFSVYLILLCAGLGVGVRISGEYLAVSLSLLPLPALLWRVHRTLTAGIFFEPTIQSQKFTTPHQLLGFITVALAVFQLVFTILHYAARRRALAQGQDRRQPATGPLASIHTWGGRLLWLLLLVNCGL